MILSDALFLRLSSQSNLSQNKQHAAIQRTSEGVHWNQRPLQNQAQARDLCGSGTRPGTSTKTGLR